MAFKRLVAAAASVALMTAPTVALAQSSAAAATREIAPADEDVEGSGLRGGFIIPLIALIAVLLGLCAADVICSGDEDPPSSP